MKREIRKVLVAVALVAGVIGIGMNGNVAQASDNTTGTYNEEEQCWITNNGYWEYQQCENLDGSIEIAILEYKGTVNDPIVPAEINGYPVTAVSTEAFYQNETITMVELPQTVRDIGAGAFTRCTNLTSVTIDVDPNGIKFEPVEGMEYLIGENAFYGCTSLTTLQLPQGITTIDENAFYGCSELETLTIPETVTVIGNAAFYGCSSLYEIILPDNVETLGYSAFNGCSKLALVKLSPALNVIDHHTFDSCTALESIIIPEGVTEIDFGAFQECTNLKIAVIPESVGEIKFDSFFNCSNLTIYAEKDSSAMLFADNVNNHVNGIPVKSATGPVSVNPAGWMYMTHNGEAEIVGYTGTLAAIEIPFDIEGNPVTSVAGRIFKESKITSLELSESVLSIGDDLCNGCTQLEEITFSTTLIHIGDSAFTGCTALSRVRIPSGVNYIGSHAFDGCTKLTSVSFIETDSDVTEEIEIGIYAFKDCDLESINIPAGVRDIGEYTFYGNANMTSAALPEGIEHISSHAFYGCSKLKGIKLPSTLTYIWDYAFAGCTGIEEIEIPNQVTNIEQRAFAGCTALKKTTILSNVKTIGTRVFGDCDSLTIYTNAGSTAETYAKNNDIPYVIIGGTSKPPVDDDNTQNSGGDSVTKPPVDDNNTQNTVTQPSDSQTSTTPPKKVKVPTVAKVKKFKATAKKKALVLSWKKVSGVDGYQIRIGTKKSLKGAKTIMVKKTKTKYTVSKLKSKKKYYIQIRAYKTYKDAKGKKKKAYSKAVVINKKTK